MFSGISSYIFGADQSVPDITCELQTKDADNEWVLVDIAEKKPVSTHGAEEATGDTAESSDQSVPLPNVAPEESWFVTPPPCFTAGGHSPVHLEPNPMEDLLIEHPSMSVYGVAPQEENVSANSERNIVSAGSASSSATGQPSEGALSQRPPRRAAAVAAKLSIEKQQAMLVRSQKHQQKDRYKSMSKGKLQHSNKVYHRQNCSRRQRKKDLMTKQCMKVCKTRC